MKVLQIIKTGCLSCYRFIGEVITDPVLLKKDGPRIGQAFNNLGATWIYLEGQDREK
jgi:hypothetical protein